jgi:glycosyltransferase involved in cell wall biosynthesis
MPVYNPPEQYLREAIESVLDQVYPHWEFCIADDASTKPYVKQVLEEYAKLDNRIKVVYRSENGHISRCSNSALELATGEYIALLDHDDLLTPDALYEVVFLINQHPEADMIYSDEDKIDENNKLRDPFFKPDWCPDSFLSRMYICHLGTYRRTIINQIGGFRVGYEGSQDYDLVLRFTEQTDKIFHVPKILYHWRIHSQSAASGSEAKPYAYLSARKALSDALSRRGEMGSVTDVPGYSGHYIIRYEIDDYNLVSIIIPTRDLGYVLNQCLESIFAKSTYPNYEVILIDNGSTEPYTFKVINYWLNQEPERFRCYSLAIPFNYSKLNNYGARKARGKYLLFLNNDTEVIVSDWIEAMVEQAQRPSIGAVGALLLYPDDTVQHAGVVVGLGGVAGHGHVLFDKNSTGYCGQLISVNNYSAVTGACLMCNRDKFEAINGFNEELAVTFNDVDFCLKFLEKGYRNIWLPHVKLYHYESKSRGKDLTPEKQARFLSEVDYMSHHWKHVIERDPCYNPNLTLQRPDYGIREPELI